MLPAYNDNLLRALLSLKVVEKDIPSLAEHEVLVKMEGAPCNPSDIAFLRGGYNVIRQLPCVPGFEGTGVVIEAGTKAIDMKGKRVSCFVQDDRDGTWADYFIARKQDCIEVRDELSVEQAACLAINPLTAWALFEQVLQSGTTALVQNAAGGQVPGLIRQLAAKHQIGVINLVRKSARKEAMEASGIRYVLDTLSETFQHEFDALMEKLKPGIGFDAVGGDSTATLLHAMPQGGKVVVYGALSGNPIQNLDPMQVIFKDKSITGFNLNDWLVQIPEDKLSSITGEIQHRIIRNELHTTIQGSYPLQDVVAALRAYIKSMSAGKIILIP